MERDALVMYILVNTDLKMGVGKKCSQVGHVVAAIVEELAKNKPDILRRYKQDGQAKIVLKASQATMEDLLVRYPAIVREVHDAGHTQVEAGSLTAIGFFPLMKRDVPEEIHALKLL